MAKFGLLFLVSLTPVHFVFAVYFSARAFKAPLSYGVRHPDVVTLQKMLNADPETMVSEIGPGSPGNETDYFGPATRRAILLFQEKYHTEILAPLGLTRGTGFLGEKTREKLRELLDYGGSVTVTKVELAPPTVGSSSQTITPSPLRTADKVRTATSSEESPKGPVFLMFLSQYSGTPGTTISLQGAGFTRQGNTVSFGTHTVSNVSSPNGSVLTLAVPRISPGIYPLLVENTHGESNKGTFFVVTDGVSREPVIAAITPKRAPLGTTITLRGSGFSTSSNMVRTGVQILEGIPSLDGTTLSFILRAPVFEKATPKEQAWSREHGVTFPLWIRVVNEKGVSNAEILTLEL